MLRFAPKEVLSARDINALEGVSNAAVQSFVADRLAGNDTQVEVVQPAAAGGPEQEGGEQEGSEGSGGGALGASNYVDYSKFSSGGEGGADPGSGALGASNYVDYSKMGQGGGGASDYSAVPDALRGASNYDAVPSSLGASNYNTAPSSLGGASNYNTGAGALGGSNYNTGAGGYHMAVTDPLDHGRHHQFDDFDQDEDEEDEVDERMRAIIERREAKEARADKKREARMPKEVTGKYTGKKILDEKGSRYPDEFWRGSKILPIIVANMEKSFADKKVASVAAGMQKVFGWTQEDCDKYLAKVPNLGTDSEDIPKVQKLDEDQRKDFELIGGSPFKQGTKEEVYDTKGCFSKFAGSGFAIFVMAPDGKIYAGQHKVGLFHHSSFLSGGKAAGAGEIKVDGGRLTKITNKSGHYIPGVSEVVQTFAELQSRGVSLDIPYVHVNGFDEANSKKEYPGGAKAFYEQHKGKDAEQDEAQVEERV